MNKAKFRFYMWFLFVTTTLLPALYVIYYEAIPRDYEVPQIEIKSNVWTQNFTPLPTPKFDEKKAHMGKILYFDHLISLDGKRLCESCHRIENNRPAVCFEVPSASCITCHTAPTRGSGTNSAQEAGKRNALGVWNSRYNLGYGWEAREIDLVSFVRSHIADELGLSDDQLMQNLQKRDIYKEIKTADQAVENISEFVKSLVATNSRFDRYLRGEKDAMTPEQLEGFELFKKKGCSNCHNGINIGGNSLKTFGVYKLHKLNDGLSLFALIKSSFEDENLRRFDEGAKRLTGWSMDNYLFRVASLRNVEITRPYFTEGQVWELEEAVRTMGRVQLGIKLTEAEVASITAFLGSISGVIPIVEYPKELE